MMAIKVYKTFYDVYTKPSKFLKKDGSKYYTCSLGKTDECIPWFIYPGILKKAYIVTYIQQNYIIKKASFLVISIDNQ